MNFNVVSLCCFQVDIQLPMSDLKFDTFRSSGAGGQHVNTTDSGVRVTHKPTGAFRGSRTQTRSGSLD